MVQFDEKLYFYLLGIVPVLVLLFLLLRVWRKSKQRQFADAELLKRLIPEKSGFKSSLKLIFLLLGIIFLTLGLVNPKIGTKLETVKREGVDIVFAVDVSKSMLAEDIAPNRIEKSKRLVSEIINQLASDRIGIIAYAGSFGLISKLRLWKYFLIPILICLLTATIIGFTAYTLSDNIGRFVTQIWIWEWGKEAFLSFSSIVSAIAILVIGLILYKHIVMALAAPFMSPVSEKIEAHLTNSADYQHRNTSFKEQLWRGILINLRNLGKELLYTAPLLLLKFIPFVNIASTILLFLMQAYYAGFGNMDYTLERHFKYRESVKFVRKNRGFAIGNGIVFMLFLMIPFIGIILVLPLSVTAASKKTVELLKEENLFITKEVTV